MNDRINSTITSIYEACNNGIITPDEEDIMISCLAEAVMSDDITEESVKEFFKSKMKKISLAIKKFKGKRYAVKEVDGKTKVIAPKFFKGDPDFQNHINQMIRNTNLQIEYQNNFTNWMQQQEAHQRAAEQAMRDTMNASHMASAAAMNSAMGFTAMPMGPIM